MFKIFKRLLILSIIAIFTASSLLYADDEPVLSPDRFDKLFGETWYGVYVQGGKVGYAITSFEGVTEPIDGWMATQSMTMIISALGVTDTMKVIDERIY